MTIDWRRSSVAVFVGLMLLMFYQRSAGYKGIRRITGPVHVYGGNSMVWMYQVSSQELYSTSEIGGIE